MSFADQVPVEDLDARWRELSEIVPSGMKEWRLQHPRATLREREVPLDERLAEQRAWMLEDEARASEMADLIGTTRTQVSGVWWRTVRPRGLRKRFFRAFGEKVG